MLYLCRSIPIKDDSRAKRFVELFEENGIQVKALSWGSEDPHDISPKFLPRYRDKKAINLISTLIFNCWLIYKLLLLIRKDDFIFSVDLDTRFACYIVQVISRVKVLYDISDPFSLSRLNGRFSFLDSVESFLSSKSIVTIFPSYQRSTILKSNENSLIIENVPVGFSATKYLPLVPTRKKPIILGYFGSLEPSYRLLELTTELVLKSNSFQLVVGGSGGLGVYFESLSNKFPEKIKYHGKYKHIDLIDLISVCHVSVAFYSLKKSHHAYVASNKQYEHLILQKPCLTNAGTSLSDFVKKNNTGWVVEESEINEEALLNILYSEDYLVKVNNCARVWDSEYKNYWVSNQSVKHLISIIKKPSA